MSVEKKIQELLEESKKAAHYEATDHNEEIVEDVELDE